MAPRIPQAKIEYAYKVDKGEAFGSAFSSAELIEKIKNEVAYLKDQQPVAVLTGSYVTIPVTCQILHIPLAWVVQSTWLPGFFAHGAGMTDSIRFAPLKKVADLAVLALINLWIRIGLLGALNKAARHFGVPGFQSIFDYWRGDLNLVAEPAEFSGAELPANYYFIGPLIARQDFPIPEAVKQIPHDQPLIYFAMGSSGTPQIIANIIESFAGKPYRVIAPVKAHLNKVSGVRVPANVIVTEWLPALQINKLVDLSVIHGGVGTVMTAAYAGKPVVGVGMQPEQVANLACLVRKGIAVRVPKSKHLAGAVQEAIQHQLHNEDAKRKAAAFAEIMETWDGPKMAAQLLYETFG